MSKKLTPIQEVKRLVCLYNSANLGTAHYRPRKDVVCFSGYRNVPTADAVIEIKQKLANKAA